MLSNAKTYRAARGACNWLALSKCHDAYGAIFSRTKTVTCLLPILTRNCYLAFRQHMPTGQQFAPLIQSGCPADYNASIRYGFLPPPPLTPVCINASMKKCVFINYV